MIEIIKELFWEASYIVEEIQPEFKSDIEHLSFIAKITKENKFDFFLVIDLKEVNIDESNLHDIIDDYFEYIVDKNEEQGIDKNLSLLILLQKDTVKIDRDLTSFVYDLEEDPYDFKKYVLSYTKEQFSLVEQQFKNENSITSVFQRIIQNKNMFSEFKNTTNKESQLIYDLISKCFIKLHFLSLQIDTINLSNLESEIREELTQYQLDLREKIISIESKEEINLELVLEKLGVVEEDE
ncbi:hypothetical protein SAMN05421663_10575 [Terribacillus halophilus]|uniref:Uncharacterized protein n=1 Tax=Terribacillus halophilus TaxID=361279 RepID=A0A1G6QI22_9BACI|nr:ABC-three component system middle component 1 [Terribacillus halophilus]SDC91574.1 hypothetical protein SAMN05421663_10575 [Terribacillus halophilus]